MIDKALLAIAPGWARRRAENRLRFEIADIRRGALASTYGAADRSRLSADWKANQGSADSTLIPDLATINARARQAVRDDWAAASIRDAYRRHVVGTGISCRSAARDPETGEPLTEFNKAADRIWQQWCRAKWCDIERRKSFCEFQGLMISELATVGSGLCLIRSDESRRGVPGVVLQAIEPEMLDLERTLNPQTGYEIRSGVEIDTYGAPVAYWVYATSHPYDSFPRKMTFQSERIPAEQVCHIMRQERARQTFGVTRFAPILKKLRHLGMYDEYQIVAARIQACMGMFVKTPGGGEADLGLFGTNPGSGGSTTDESGNKLTHMEPGMVHYGAPGEEPIFNSPKAPGEFYDGFSRRQIHQAAAGSGLDYPTVSRDFSGNTFSGQRQGMIERDYETDPLQWMLIDQFCIPVRDQVIMAAVMQGMLEAPAGFFDTPDMYLEAEWRPQAKPWIDPQVQATAAEVALRNRLTTHRALLNEQGEDWRETFQQLADEQAEMERLGISGAEEQQQQQPAGPQSDPELERIKAEADAYGVAVRAGVVTPQTDDEDAFRTRLSLPSMSADAKRAWAEDKGVRRPITLLPPGGKSAGPAGPGVATAPGDPKTDPQDDPEDDTDPEDDPNPEDEDPEE